MAAYSHNDRGNRASFHGGNSFDAHLPSGSCHFRDLTNGSNAPVCGCRRFWLDSTRVAVSGAERGWCFCGHHACFHSAFSQRSQQEDRPMIHNIAEQRSAASLAGHSCHGRDYGSGNVRSVAVEREAAGLGIRAGSYRQTPSVNTRLWDALNGFARQQEPGEASDGTSGLPSTAVPSICGVDDRMSPNRMLADTIQYCQPLVPHVDIPNDPNTRQGAADYPGSATEMATPSINGTPDLRNVFTNGTDSKHSTMQFGAAQTAAPAEPKWPSDNWHRRSLHLSPPSTSARLPADVTQLLGFSATELRELMRSYGHRLQALETLSFDHVPAQDVQDKLDLCDGRLLDLEHWRSEQEKAQEMQDSIASSSRHGMLHQNEHSSFGSDLSFDQNAAAHAEAAVLATLAANAEIGPRIDSLEARVAGLEDATLPSYQRPWHVEVVLLPWGREMRGIWFSSVEASQQSMKSQLTHTDDWTGLDRTAKTSFTSSCSAAWTTESIQAWAEDAKGWLSPKACGPRSTVFQRLASRGLVRNVTLTGSDARHISNQISDTFGAVLGEHDTSADEDVDRFRGLRERFIPLRKVRKSSRLRFLSPSEMVTPTAWGAEFLDTSVLMKVQDQQRRLYITTPSAYLQSDTGNWSWSRVKALQACDADGEPLPGQVETTAAIQACWVFNDRLDYPPSLHTSFGTHASDRSHWGDQSQPANASEAHDAINVPAATSTSAETDQQNQSRKRTVSLPLSASSLGIARQGFQKRRVASLEATQTIPLSGEVSSTLALSKRRRMSTSPEAERRAVYMTPRWSREPPSPFTTDLGGIAKSQATSSSSRKRGTTPFAYATPHSNNLHGVLDATGGENDTVCDSDIGEDQCSEGGEEEWHGVDDDVADDIVGSSNEDQDDEI